MVHHDPNAAYESWRRMADPDRDLKRYADALAWGMSADLRREEAEQHAAHLAELLRDVQRERSLVFDEAVTAALEAYDRWSANR